MKISLIIPVYNAQDTIGLCLEYIRNQERLPEEIILVDNGSSDKSVQIIKQFIDNHKDMNIILEFEAKKGPGAARNKGLLKASGDIIAFTDSDCFARKDWIKNLCAVYENNEVDAVGGIACIYDPKTPSEKLQAIDHVMPRELYKKMITQKYGPMILGTAVVTFNGSYKRKVFDKINGFDENFAITCEDIDLCVRAFEQGFKMMIWHPDIVVWHMPRKNYWLYVKRIFQYRMSLALLLKKHFTKEAFIQLPGSKVLRFKFCCNMVITKEFQVILSSVFLLILLNKLFLLILPIVAVFLGIRFFRNIFVKAKELNLKFSLKEVFEITCMDIVKKLASEYGRFYGSVKNRSIYI